MNPGMNHPWKNTGINYLKLKSARRNAAKLRSLKYRNEHIEERRLLERNWHRKKSGMDVEAPIMTKSESGKKGSAIRWAKDKIGTSAPATDHK